MRFLLALILAAAGMWSVYWFFGANRSQAAFETWFEERRNDGWLADYSDLSVQGFPNRFDATFRDISLADPGTGLAWRAPVFQILALSYKPHHVIAVWPQEQLLATPLGKYALASKDMRASLVLQPDSQLALERSTLTAADFVATPSGPQGPVRIEAFSLAIERVEAGASTYRLGVAADGVQPAVSIARMIDPKGTLPDTLDALNADLTVTFDKPWNRSAIEEARPQPREIRIRLVQARWGQLELQLAGRVSVDMAGLPDGRITVKARNWRDILKLAMASGAIPQGLGSTLEDALGLISGLSGNPETLDIPLDFRNGRMLLGPVPLGPAPVLAIR